MREGGGGGEREGGEEELFLTERENGIKVLLGHSHMVLTWFGVCYNCCIVLPHGL